MLTCAYKPQQHGFWPVQFHPEALRLANLDRPRVKLSRMVNHLCLICGGPTRPAR